MKETIFIDTPGGVAGFIDLVERQDKSRQDLKPFLYIDAEGERLSRAGTISLLTISVRGLGCPFIIDIHTLGNIAFCTVGTCGKSLKDILESPQILKAFFDVRNDSDALYAHYGIELQGVRDVQLMQSACQPTTHSRRFISGLSKCIGNLLRGRKLDQWKLDKENGERLWNPQKGGSYTVFNTRPPSKEILSYCAGEVQYLSAMYRMYRRGTERWGDLVAQESQKRVFASQTVSYQPHGAGRTLSPWSLEQNIMLDSWSEVNPSVDYF
ncbi:hypothetical protein NUW58_g3921 [Xylaria curta]|uniref:Uncharacterized protein n=1 Tax=Xylaria curta TaxID=42375 RepID=A0ACC1PB98_9PEZI|nr:hypothetical protein NUW58_g3921 [Xylaria curta]